MIGIQHQTVPVCEFVCVWGYIRMCIVSVQIIIINVCDEMKHICLFIHEIISIREICKKCMSMEFGLFESEIYFFYPWEGCGKIRYFHFFFFLNSNIEIIIIFWWMEFLAYQFYISILCFELIKFVYIFHHNRGAYWKNSAYIWFRVMIAMTNEIE